MMKRAGFASAAMVLMLFTACGGGGGILGGGDYTESQYGIDMAYVKGGTFVMGCTPEQGGDCDNDEHPARQVTLSDFYIGKHEGTINANIMCLSAFVIDLRSWI